MKWVTRAKARVDRIACPWLITRFIDPDPTFLFVPAREVMAVAEREGAIPYDVPGVELGHHGERCSFDAFLDKYELRDPALQALAPIVRGADTDARQLTPESAGLYALATGFQAMTRDDFDNMRRQFPAYDALYAYCRATAGNGAPTVLFVCLHGAAKSVLGAAYFQRLADERGVKLRAEFVGTEPEPELAPRVARELSADGIDLGGRRPRALTPADVTTASRVVSFGCDLGKLAGDRKVERWDDVPNVSDGYEAARDAIVKRLPELLARVSRADR
jgi:protein-tyrosine-phosphatase